MGKCTKKSKRTAEVPLVEISRRSSMAPGGVRTRAKTLALRRLRMNTTPNPTPSSCYLELRSRRLHKPPRAPIKPRNQLPRPKQCSRESRGFHSSCRDERDGSSVASCRRTAASCSEAAVSRSCEGHLDHESRTERGDSEESFGGENNLELLSLLSSLGWMLSVQASELVRCTRTYPRRRHRFGQHPDNPRDGGVLCLGGARAAEPLPGRFEWARVHP